MGKSKIIRTGMSLLGMVMSYMFGVNFLGGLAGTVDNIGNIIVDVSEGIGFVSKAIDFVERFIDPSDPKEDKLPEAIPSAPPVIDVPQPVLCKKGNCVPYDPTKDRVLQQKLIQIEREKILQGAAQVPPITTPSPELIISPSEASPTMGRPNVAHYKSRKKGPPYKNSGPKGRQYSFQKEEDDEDD